MAAAFGFVGGDFGAAVELVTTVANALRENSEASEEYCELVRQIYSLEVALLRVKRLKVGDSQPNELVGLRQAAAQCQQTIDGFWKKTQEYQPHLRSNGSSSRLKGSWMKIKWSVCNKDDVAQFKADIASHTMSIYILLVTVQMEGANVAKETQELHNKTLATKLQVAYTDVSQRLSSSIGQGKQLLHMVTKILRWNLRIFETVVKIQTMMASLPNQIGDQQPVYLIDALGKHSSFDLRLFTSAEYLISVFKINFRPLGEEAVRKIERGRFVIQDSATKRDIDLSANWDVCFHPGQHVEMSIIFTDWDLHSRTKCPKCEKECIYPMNSDTECLACGTNFRRTEDTEPSLEDLETSISRLTTGPREPKRRSTRLLDLIQRVRINMPPPNPLEVESTSSTIGTPGPQSSTQYSTLSLPTHLGSLYDAEDDSRSASGSIKPRSGDMTPLTAGIDSNGIELISDRDKRKLADIEKTFERMELRRKKKHRQ